MQRIMPPANPVSDVRAAVHDVHNAAQEHALWPIVPAPHSLPLVRDLVFLAVGGLTSSMILSAPGALSGGYDEGAYIQEEPFERRGPVEGISMCWCRKCIARHLLKYDLCHKKEGPVRYVCTCIHVQEANGPERVARAEWGWRTPASHGLFYLDRAIRATIRAYLYGVHGSILACCGIERFGPTRRSPVPGVQLHGLPPILRLSLIHISEPTRPY